MFGGTEVWDTSAGKVRRVQGYMYVTNKRNWSREQQRYKQKDTEIYRETDDQQAFVSTE